MSSHPCHEAAGPGPGNILWRLCLLCWVVLCGSLPVQAYAADALPDGYEALMLAVRINRQPPAPAMPVLRAPDGSWLLPVDLLRAANLRIPDASPLRFNEADYLPLDALRVSRTDFDPASQSLAIAFLPDQFGATALNAREPQVQGTPAAAGGAFLNYQLSVDRSAAGAGYSLFAEAAASVAGGVALSSHGLFDRPGLGREMRRLESSFTRDDLARMARLRLGDAVTRPATGLGRPVRFAGLQWGTNFLTRPDLVTVPVATLSGQAALPSTLDLYVDNVLQARRAVPPGPFSITSAPLVTGEGEVLLKLTDLAGQEQVISQRIYASTMLLAPGLHDYSVEAGALRKNFGFADDGYEDGFVSGSWRHGLSPRLTVEMGGSLLQGGRSGLLGGLAAALPGIGIVSMAAGLSRSEAGNGTQLALGLERRNRDTSLSLRTQYASEDYRQLGVLGTQTLRRLDSAFFGYRIGQIGRLGLSYVRQQRPGTDPVAVSTLSFSTRQTDWGSLVLSLSQSRASSTEQAISLFWVKSLGRATSLSASHAQRSNGTGQDVLQLHKTMAPGEGWGYRLQAARHAPNQASVFGQNGMGNARLDLAEFNGDTSVRATMGGGIAWLDGQWFASRRIDSSYGLVSLPGFSNVRVYVDNQLAGRTNADGYALLPRLTPYMKNQVSVEPFDLPLDVQADAFKMQPVPSWRSGVRIDFPIRALAAATLDLMLENGTPVPLGALVRREEGDDSVVVGHDGLLYLTDLVSEQRINATWPGGRCRAQFSYRPEPGSVPHLGRVLCRQWEATP